MPRSRASSVASDDYASCFGAVCSFFGCLLCFTKMKPSSRIALTWFWLVVIAVIGASIVSNIYFKSSSVTMHPSDMRILDSTSTNWCLNTEITSGRPIDIYRLKSEPELLTASSERLSFEFEWHNTLITNGYEHWEFYLLKKSTIYMNIQRLCIGNEGYSGDVYVFKGDANYHKWKKQPSCSDCYAQQTAISDCRQRLIQFNVEENDQYYFVVYNGKSRKSISIRLRFRLQRSIYDISANSLACVQETNCVVSMDSYESLVATYSVNKHSHAEDETSVKVKCEPRYFVFVPVFVLIPLSLGLVITCIIVTRANRRQPWQQRRSSDVFTISGRDQTHSGIVSPVFMSEPPSYEECSGNPPSYDEVLLQKRLNSEA